MTIERPTIPALQDIRHVHLIAVCGTGMGSLAGMLKERGLQVTGSDQNIYPPMSTQLVAQGVELREGYRAENIADQPDLVVVGNAVSRNNPEVEALLAGGIPFVSFPEALELFFLQNRLPVVITGTHGKTTTASLAAWVLDACGLAPGFMIGGMAKNFSHNGRTGTGEPFVIEGDEYDSAFFDKEPKFFHYGARIGVLTSIEFDHGDIYPDFSVLVGKFARFVSLIPPSGTLIACTDFESIRELLPQCPGRVVTYGFQGTPDWSATDIAATPGGGTRFTLLRRGEAAGTVTIPMTGRHNVANALSVLAVAETLQLAPADVQRGLDGFSGITRRQDLVAEVEGVSIYDDFAHHPTAVAETIEAIRMRHPQGRLFACFEPRSNTSRRKVFQDSYPQAFAGADLALVAPVFRAEALSDEERLDVPQLVSAIEALGVTAEAPESASAIIERLTALVKPGDVVLIMSNGGFEGIHQRLAQALEARQPTQP